MMLSKSLYTLAFGCIGATIAIAQQPDVPGIARPAYTAGEPADSIIATMRDM